MAAASHYEQFSNNQKTAGQTLITLSGVKSGEKVLDLGCGTGHLAVVLSEIVGPEGRVVAVDPDGERIKIAREKYNRPNIEFLVADDRTCPGNGYDLVFCSIVIEEVKDKEAFFVRVHQKLRSGGRFAILASDGGVAYPSVIINALSELVGPEFLDTLKCRQQMFVCADTYCQLAESAGFVVTFKKLESTTVEWSNLEELISYFHGVSHGLFDISTVSKEGLEKYGVENNLSTFQVSFDRFYLILTKI